MKVLLINDYGVPTGGAEVSILGLREKLRAMGHDARLFASSARVEGLRSQADYDCFGTIGQFRTLLQTLNPFAYFKLRRVLREFQPDVVLVQLILTQISPLILPLLRNYRSVYLAMWQRSICPTGFKLLPTGKICQERHGLACIRNRCLSFHDWLLLQLQMKMWQRWRSSFDRIISISQSLSRQLAQDGTESDDVLFLGTPTRPARPKLTSQPMACFAGRLSREKGPDVLLRAFALVQQELPEARLLIAGDGPLRNEIEKSIDRLGIRQNVTMLGHLSRTELESTFANAWVQIVPTIMQEAFGLVVAEAMMRGTAVIASNCGGPSELVVHGETGLLIEPNDHTALAGTLLLLLKDRQMAEEFGANGRKKAQAQLNDEMFAERLAGIFEDLTKTTMETVYAA